MIYGVDKARILARRRMKAKGLVLAVGRLEKWVAPFFLSRSRYSEPAGMEGRPLTERLAEAEKGRGPWRSLRRVAFQMPAALATCPLAWVWVPCVLAKALGWNAWRDDARKLGWRKDFGELQSRVACCGWLLAAAALPFLKLESSVVKRLRGWAGLSVEAWDASWAWAPARWLLSLLGAAGVAVGWAAAPVGWISGPAMAEVLAREAEAAAGEALGRESPESLWMALAARMESTMVGMVPDWADMGRRSEELFDSDSSAREGLLMAALAAGCGAAEGRECAPISQGLGKFAEKAAADGVPSQRAWGRAYWRLRDRGLGGGGASWEGFVEALGDGAWPASCDLECGGEILAAAWKFGGESSVGGAVCFALDRWAERFGLDAGKDLGKGALASLGRLDMEGFRAGSRALAAWAEERELLAEGGQAKPRRSESGRL